jgi:uncharacterized protein (TIGR03000 family)
MVRKFSVSLVVGLLTCGLSAGNALAGWGSWGGSYGSNGSSGGSYASYGSSGSHGSWGSGYGSSGGSYGSWGGGHSYGPIRGLFANWHARKMARHAAHYSSYGSSGGSWGGSWGSSGGGSYGSSGGFGSSGYASSGYGSSGGSYGTWTTNDCVGCEGGAEVTDGTIIEEEGSSGSEMKSEPIESEPATSTESRRPVRKGVLSVSVPAEARVLVNGMATTSTGPERRYVSHGLKPGQTYRYVVKAVMDRDGKQVAQTKVATLRAGRITTLDFDFDGTNAVETSLTLNVPDDATVYLSGHSTQATGSQRRFSTTRIEDGQKWADYLVRVTVDRNGRTLTKEQRVTLHGGDQTALDFQFDQTELADAR